jgi:hypothetical protein
MPTKKEECVASVKVEKTFWVIDSISNLRVDIEPGEYQLYEAHLPGKPELWVIGKSSEGMLRTGWEIEENLGNLKINLKHS